MNKHTILLAAMAVGAATTAFVPAAQAKGGHGHGHFHFHSWTPTFSSSYDDEAYARRRRTVQKVYVEKKVAAVAPKLIDDKGRQYDPAAKVWFDGKGQCFSGKEAFALKSGNWFYGSARWYELNGAWKTNAADGPATIDCEASPVFAAKLQGKAKPKDATPAKDIGQNGDNKVEPAKKEAAAATPPVKVAVEEPAKAADAPKATECKKYFPSVGEMLTVPCGQ